MADEVWIAQENISRFKALLAQERDAKLRASLHDLLTIEEARLAHLRDDVRNVPGVAG